MKATAPAGRAGLARRRLPAAAELATVVANVVFWAWPAAPPRLSLPGMTDLLVAHDILGAAHPHRATSLVNLYTAMPSLYVAWAVWCAAAAASYTANTCPAGPSARARRPVPGTPCREAV